MTTSPPRPADGPRGAAEQDHSPARPSRPLIERTVLDHQVAPAREADPRPWGAVSWLGPLLTLAAIIGVGQLVGATAARRGGIPLPVGIGMTVAAEGVMFLALLAFGRRIAAPSGGWLAP